ncbi:hypothetical protein VPHK24_0009 [Vibrio phage K24]
MSLFLFYHLCNLSLHYCLFITRERIEIITKTKEAK